MSTNLEISCPPIGSYCCPLTPALPLGVIGSAYASLMNESYDLPSVREQLRRRQLSLPMASRLVEALKAAGCPRERAERLVAEEAWLTQEDDEALMLWLCGCGRACRDLEALGSDFEVLLEDLIRDVIELNAELEASGGTARWSPPG